MPAPAIITTSSKTRIKEGWTITHDPYILTFGQRNVFVDLNQTDIGTLSSPCRRVIAVCPVISVYEFLLWTHLGVKLLPPPKETSKKLGRNQEFSRDI